jgi:hypothetical protein
VATNAKDALNASHTGTLVICRNDLFLLLFGVSSTRVENTAFATVLAPELLTAAGIVTIFDYVGAATCSTLMNDSFCYHATTIPSLQLDQHQIFIVRQIKKATI